MAELNRDGHRQRIKDSFIDNPETIMADHNLLEILLTYSIPRKDVKQIAYDLINHFGSLENVFNANRNELMSIDGVGENTATLIMLNKAIYKKIIINHNKEIHRLNSARTAIRYVNNIIQNSRREKFIVITLDNDLKIINSHIDESGEANHIMLDKNKILRYAISDNATAVIIAHNHPKGNAQPSSEDVAMTIDLLGFLRELNIRLLDHVIVGEKSTKCMSTMISYADFFK